MNSSSAISAAKHFLSVVWDGDRPGDKTLLAALDGLVAAYHVTPVGDVSDADVDAPRQNGASLYAEVAARFPTYGAYPVVDPTGSLDDALMVADTIDDLADLTLDMHEVLWLADHVSLNDAHFAFRLQFFHWGQHARELSLYLCGRLFG